jgi:hypothetical protein
VGRKNNEAVVLNEAKKDWSVGMDAMKQYVQEGHVEMVHGQLGEG